MDAQIALLLAQDGVVNGAIYALLALALVLVFAVTRVIFIPQGEFVAFGALTLAALQAGQLPATVWLLCGLGLAVSMQALWRRQAQWGRTLAVNLVYPLLLWALLEGFGGAAQAAQWPLPLQIGMVLAVVAPLGPMLYRLAYEPLAQAPVLVLLIVSVAVHLSLVGLGLLMFGAEGVRAPAFAEGALTLGPVELNAQSLMVLGSSALLIALLFFLFEHTLTGKALRATAIHRTGARLMGISTAFAGRLSFLMAALIGAFSGVLIAPLTIVHYSFGFLIGLKGFVGAIIGGLASYPLAASGALLVGLIESFSSFYASAYKEVIVFTLIIPVLLWRSLTVQHIEEED